MMNRFQARQFAADAKVATGTIQVADWARARESMTDPAAEIAYRVEGGADGSGRPRLLFELTGTVQVLCQRCLQPMPLTLSGRTSLLLAANQRQLDAWDSEVEDAEVVLADEPLDLDELLEDEFLLSLPFSPMCDDPGCARRPVAASGESVEIRVEAGMDASNPFGALRGKLISKQSN